VNKTDGKKYCMSDKVKAVLEHANEGIRRVEVQLHSSTSSALNGVELVSYMPRLFYPQGKVPVSIKQEAEWAPEPVWML
jgi:hypothetical protein